MSTATTLTVHHTANREDLTSGLGASPKAKEKRFDVSGIDDESWRVTVAAALRMVAHEAPEKGATQLSPAHILPQALDYAATLLPEDYWRLEQKFVWGREKRKGAIRVLADQDAQLKALETLFARPSQPSNFKRKIAVTSLYAYALHLQGIAQKRTYGFVAEHIAASLKDPVVFERVRRSTDISEERLQEYCNDTDKTVSNLMGNGSAMIDASKIYQAQGRNPLKVFHAATIASTDDEFKLLVTHTEAEPGPELLKA